jgi:hypothetical protein
MRLAAVVAAFLLVAGLNNASSGSMPLEDEAGWNCQTQGNRVCGSSEGK